MVKYSVILLVALISVVASSPVPTTEHNSKEEIDVEFVPLEKQRPGVPRGIMEDDYDDDGSSYFPGGISLGRFNPFSTSFYDSMEAMMTRMRQQLSQVLSRLPSRGAANPDSANIPNLHVPSFGDLDLSKGNTTSVTKIIDGHKVVINETEYNNHDSNGGAFFKIRIIDVNPASGEATEKDAEAITTAPSGPSTPREVEPLEESLDNEISKYNEDTNSIYDNVETFDEEPYIAGDKKIHVVKTPIVPKPTAIPTGVEKHSFLPVTQKPKPYSEHDNNEWDDVDQVEDFGDGVDLGFDQQPYRDLSNDILINQYMADAGAPTNPWAENINTDDIDAEINVKDLRRTGGQMYHK